MNRYYLIFLLLSQTAALFCSQPSQDSLQQFLSRLFPCNMAPVQPHVLYSSRDWYYLSDQEKQQKTRQLVIKSEVCDSTWHQIHCSRFDSDVIMLFYLIAKNGKRVFAASSYSLGSVYEQIVQLQQLLHQEQQDLAKICLTILYPRYDRGTEFGTQLIMESYKKQIKESLCNDPEFFGYNLVSGTVYRDKNHLTCVMTKDGISWQSATDHYQQHRIQ